MLKSKISKPTLIMLYGLPGAGKAVFARELANLLKIAHVSSDEIRAALFDNPDYSKQQEIVVANMMNMMTGNFLRAGVSVVYDLNAAKLADRMKLRDLARSHKAESLLVWLQIDAESAYAKAKTRHDAQKHKIPATPIDEATFRSLAEAMQNPYLNEEYTVLSGKHLFAMQKKAILRKLHDARLLSDESLQPKIPMPGLVNLVSQATNQHTPGRVDLTRRNINIK